MIKRDELSWKKARKNDVLLCVICAVRVCFPSILCSVRNTPTRGFVTVDPRGFCVVHFSFDISYSSMHFELGRGEKETPPREQ